MTAEERTAIEWQCQQLALRFIGHNDRQEWSSMCELLTADATFARPTDPDNPIRGREAIRSAFEARPADKITRHLCTNIVVTAASTTEASGRLYALLFTGDSADTAAHGLCANARQLVGEFDDLYRRTEDGWRIARRAGRIVFSHG